MAKCGTCSRGVAPVLLGDAEVLEHHLGAQPARRQRHGGGAVRAEFVGEGEGHAAARTTWRGRRRRRPGSWSRCSRRCRRSSRRPARRGCASSSGQRVVAGDRVGLDGEPQQPQAVVEVVLPDRAVPLEELLAAPDVVDQDVERGPARRDAVDQRPDLLGLEVVGRYGDAVAAGRGDQVGGVLDGLRPVVLGAPLRGCCGRSRRRWRRRRPSSTAMPRPAPRVAPATRATLPVSCPARAPSSRCPSRGLSVVLGMAVSPPYVRASATDPVGDRRHVQGVADTGRPLSGIPLTTCRSAGSCSASGSRPTS